MSDYAPRKPKIFNKLIKKMGFKDIKDFEKTTGVAHSEIAGKRFDIIHNRVFTKK